MNDLTEIENKWYEIAAKIYRGLNTLGSRTNMGLINNMDEDESNLIKSLCHVLPDIFQFEALELMLIDDVGIGLACGILVCNVGSIKDYIEREEGEEEIDLDTYGKNDDGTVH